MTQHSVSLSGYYHRPGTAQRTLTRAPLVPSQDVTRFQAVNLPPPTYDLAPDQPAEVWKGVWVPTLAVVATGAGILLIQEFGKWLSI